jgi:hypothetical protein
MKNKLFRKHASVIPTGAMRSGGISSFKRFLAVLGMTALFCWSATAQNGVTVSNLNVASGTVTFNVSWNDNQPEDFLWSDSVWVFVDYNNGAGKMERLPLSGASLTAPSWDAASVTFEEGNNQGAWVVGNARSAGSFSATVQLLTDITDVAGACAYASNYPPVGEYADATQIKFTGTPVYNLVLKHQDNETDTIYRVSGGIFDLPKNYTLVSFTDATGAPGTFPELYATPPYAASMQTWTFGSSTLIWSDRIASTQIPCRKVTTLSSSGTNAEYAVVGDSYFINWYCVSDNASQLCPSPWRFPSKSDFEALAAATTYDIIETIWTAPGLIGSGGSSTSFAGALYIWTSNMGSENPWHMQTFFNNFSFYEHMNARYGMTVSCVR